MPPPPAPPPPPSASATSASAAASPRDVGPLVPLGYAEDRVGPRDRPVEPDGAPDFAFRVRLSGDVVSLAIAESDTHGRPLPGGGLWDTVAGKEPIPKAWNVVFAEGAQTFAIAVLEGGALLNPHGTLDRTTFHGEVVTVLVPDPTKVWFVAGRTYSLLVTRKDGTIDRATTTLL